MVADFPVYSTKYSIKLQSTMHVKILGDDDAKLATLVPHFNIHDSLPICKRTFQMISKSFLGLLEKKCIWILFVNVK